MFQCHGCRKIEDWLVDLETLKVDKAARMQLVSLARMSEQGFNEAEHVISKLLKKVGEGRAADNLSVFVMTGCQNARKDIDSWRKPE